MHAFPPTGTTPLPPLEEVLPYFSPRAGGGLGKEDQLRAMGLGAADLADFGRTKAVRVHQESRNSLDMHE